MNANLKQKRMMKEIEQLNKHPSEDYTAAPLSNDLYTWHFTIRGPTETEFEDGIYHGKIMFPFEYPLEPPDIYFLNKSGRFEVNQKICLTITGFHAEQWNASWTARTILEALISMFPEKEQVQSVGSVVHSNEVRKKLAKESWNFECEKCGPINKILKQRQKQPKETQTNKIVDNPQIQKEQNVKETVEIAKDIKIDIEKEKQNLNNLEQKLQQLQQEKPKINILQANIQQKRGPSNLQNHSQVLEQERQYSFESVAKNLEEIVNVINSIKMISNDNQNKEKEKTIPKNESSNPQKQNDIEKEDQKNQDLQQKQDLGNQKQMRDQNQENLVQKEEEQEEQKQQQNQNVDEPETNKFNDPLSQNEKLDSNLNQENKKDGDGDIPNQQQKDQENSNMDNEQQEPQSEENKLEAIQKIKKLDVLLLLTSIMFILYLTFLFQTNI
ncbi:hypothetical protein ABPG74_010961 [Tetrahymena malaccensis]